MGSLILTTATVQRSALLQASFNGLGRILSYLQISLEALLHWGDAGRDHVQSIDMSSHSLVGDDNVRDVAIGLGGRG